MTGPARPRFDAGLAAVLALPLVLLPLYDEWIHTTPCDIDAWYSFGYFVHFGEHFRNYPGAYTESRLAWLIPGRVMHSLLPPLAANLCLHLVFCWAAVGSLYLILRDTMDRRTALVGGLLLGSYSYFLQAVGWNYVDGAGLTYMLLTALAVTRAATSPRRKTCLFLGGVAGAAMIHSNLFLVVFLPILSAWHIVMTADRRIAALARDAAAAAAGMLLLTGILGAVSAMAGGQFLFFMVSISAGAQIAKYKMAESAMVPWEVWYPRSHWLRLPMFVALTALVHLVLARRGVIRANGAALFFQWWHLSAFALLAGFQWNRNPTLMGSWYASYLIPGTFLALAGQLASAIGAASRAGLLAAAAAAPAAFVLLWCLPIGSAVPTFFGKLQGHLAGLLPQMIIPALIVGILVCAARRAAVSVVLLPMLGLALGTLSYGGAYMEAYPPGFKRDTFLAIRQSCDVIRAANPENRRIRFWYGRHDHRTTCVLRALNATYLWQRAQFGTEFPAVGTTERPEPGSLLIVSSPAGGVLPAALESLRTISLDAKLSSEATVTHGRITIVLTVLEVADPK